MIASPSFAIRLHRSSQVLCGLGGVVRCVVGDHTRYGMMIGS
ncbi:hypothetical protein [Telmatospirillum sp.]|nr:hypothetical protein [Telmatospirillum sp.]MDR3440385.1 hypothetical protein [Telmatospirillum sp.]